MLEAGADTLLTSINSFDQVEMIKGLDLTSPHPTPVERKASAALLERCGGDCMMCVACAKACPQGLPVSDLMRFGMYHLDYGWPEHAESEYAALGFDFNRMAAGCGDCSRCADACPVGRASSATVRKVASLFA